MSKAPVRRERGIRSQAHLSRDVSLRLVGYLAAAAGLAASVAPAEASIVYTDVTMGAGALDLNGDGITDFTFVNRQIGSNAVSFYMYPARGNKMFEPQGYPAAARFGVPFGPAGKFAGGEAHLADFAFYGSRESSGGVWAHKWNRYMGFKFAINGEAHYGWARLTVAHEDPVITGYAYETIPNKEIHAGIERGPSTEIGVDPQSSSASSAARGGLAMLARGSQCLSIWRREDEAGVGR